MHFRKSSEEPVTDLLRQFLQVVGHRAEFLSTGRRLVQCQHSSPLIKDRSTVAIAKKSLSFQQGIQYTVHRADESQGIGELCTKLAGSSQNEIEAT